MTLKSLSDLNEVGNKAIHEKHVVALESSDSAFMRVKVKDQRFIDYLLMTDAITMDHHASAERFLQLAVSASVYLTSQVLPKQSGQEEKQTTLFILRA